MKITVSGTAKEVKQERRKNIRMDLHYRSLSNLRMLSSLSMLQYQLMRNLLQVQIRKAQFLRMVTV